MGMVLGSIDVECAKFDVVRARKDYQVRKYYPAVAAQVDTTDDNQAFKQLARYIGVFGTPWPTPPFSSEVSGWIDAGSDLAV